MADAKMLNKQRVLAKLARIPAAVQEAAKGPLEQEVDAMVGALQRACPVDAGANDGHEPGELRDSIHKYENPDRDLSFRVIAGAQDAKGWYWGRNVEFGHGDASPRPFWFPTYRAQKKGLRSKMYAVTRKAIKALFAE